MKPLASSQSPVITALCIRELGDAVVGDRASALSLLPAMEMLRGDPCPWLLESALPTSPLGRWSFAGADPYLVVRARGERVELDCRRSVRPDLEPGFRVIESDPLETIRALMPRPPATDAPLPFVGGAVGYLGYELAERIEPVSLHGRDDLDFPDMTLLFVDRLLALDHETGRAFAVGLGFAAEAAAAELRAERAADAYADRLARAARGGLRDPARVRGDDLARRRQLLATELPRQLERSVDEPGYGTCVERLIDEIAAGNVYEANLTQRLSLPFSGSAWELYGALRRENPAPFAAFLDLPDGAIVSSSPERFLRLDREGMVQSRPIKGTRPRGASAEEDEVLARQLVSSPKDRAENLMIVDLVRNDLGRVCELGSVRVPELMAVERYASVFQLVSTVEGRLAEESDAVDLVRAAFPPGSMTGAPKIAAMKLLDALEPVRRGVYSGAVGYLDVYGGMDLSVVIRTILLKKGHAYLHVGGAVVADSDPALEYRECIDKARALLSALAAADRGE
jgi:aminodeoxychorismate synthase component I